MERLENKLGETRRIMNEAIDRLLPIPAGREKRVVEAMRYSAISTGKALRPFLTMTIGEMLGVNKQTAIRIGAAIELLHTYSLIHDDLPAMDNDDYRRGRPTSHKVFGEDMAILAGDGLLHHAMETMAKACWENPCKETTGAMYAIAKGAGIHGMLTGQAVDVQYDGKPMEKDVLEFIHVHKTAAMIRGALEAGARAGGAPEEVVERFGLAGEKIGVAFQILDDILDVTSTTEELGKPVHSDEKNQKTTYVTLYGIEKSKEIAAELSRQAEEIWAEQGESCRFLRELTAYLLQRTY